jgi:hypothetical protein
MSEPLINIMTRVSRKNYFYRCYKSIHEQTYKNINHICTYPDIETGEFLSTFDNITTVRVPNLKRIEGMYYNYNHHVLTDDFITPDLEFLDKVPILEGVESKRETKKVPEIKFEKNGFFCYTFPTSQRATFKHSPYNVFLKIAEKEVKPGWVFYLDDDDYIADNTIIQKIVDQINKFDTNTIHIFKCEFGVNKIKPSDKYWEYMKAGHPFVLHEIGSSNYVFHSKYLDYTVWDEWAGADYRTAKNLERVTMNKNFVDLLIKKGISNGGCLDDLPYIK